MEKMPKILSEKPSFNQYSKSYEAINITSIEMFEKPLFDKINVCRSTISISYQVLSSSLVSI